MRVVFVSTHVDQTTGYSKVAYQLLRQMATLAPAVKIFHFGFQRHPGRVNHRKVPDGVISYDAAAAEDPKEEGFGFNKIQEYIEMVGPDLVILYNDALVVARFLESMKYKKGESPYKVWVYLDQVYLGIAQPLVEAVDNAADTVYTFTPYWKDVYTSYFPEGPKAKVKVLGHAADSEVFKAIPDRAVIRAQMRIPNNGIAILNCNRNSERKRLDLMVQGFVGLLAKDPSKPYYLVVATGANPQAGAFYDVRRVFHSECVIHKLDLASVVDRFILVDTAGQTVFTDESINQLYNACDLGINTSDGEGFGLCQLEHLQTGAPQIVTDVGSYTFLDDTVSVKIPVPIRCYQSAMMPLGSFSRLTTAEAVTEAMEKAIEKLPKLRENIRQKTLPTWSDVCDGFLEDLIGYSKK